VLVALIGVAGQAPIPQRQDGFAIGAPLSNSIAIVFEAFVDLLCPDCAQAWPTIKQVTQHYGANIHVRMHTFPLPYHTWGFYAAQAAHVIDHHQAGTAFPTFADTMFAQQQNFWNPATSNLTANDVLNNFVKVAVSTGLIDPTSFVNGMNDDNLNEETRVSWKYACSRGVLGTPTFLVNGVILPDADPSWSLQDWQQILDPLVPTKKHQHHSKKGKGKN